MEHPDYNYMHRLICAEKTIDNAEKTINHLDGELKDAMDRIFPALEESVWKTFKQEAYHFEQEAYRFRNVLRWARADVINAQHAYYPVVEKYYNHCVEESEKGRPEKLRNFSSEMVDHFLSRKELSGAR